NFTGNARGNRLRTSRFASGNDVVLGASTSNNVVDCLSGGNADSAGGGCAVSDSGTRNSVWNYTNVIASNSGDLLFRDALVRRLRPIQGTALTTSDVTLVTGNQGGGILASCGSWGSTASITTLLGTDSSGTLIITASGTGQTANPCILWTFHDGTFGT